MTERPSPGLTSPSATSDGREQEIREIAYHLWEQEGRPEGKHVAHYFQAEEVWRERLTSRQSMMPRVDGKPSAAAERTNGRRPKRPRGR